MPVAAVNCCCWSLLLVAAADWCSWLLLLVATAGRCCWSLLPIAAADCCCWLLLLIAAAGFCCWLLLVIAAAGCCCWLLLPIAAADCCCWLLLLVAAVDFCCWLLLLIAAGGCCCWLLLLVAAVDCCCWLLLLIAAQKVFEFFRNIVGDLRLRQICRRKILWIFSGCWWFAAKTNLQAKKSLNISRILTGEKWKRGSPRGSRLESEWILWLFAGYLYSAFKMAASFGESQEDPLVRSGERDGWLCRAEFLAKTSFEIVSEYFRWGD